MTDSLASARSLPGRLGGVFAGAGAVVVGAGRVLADEQLRRILIKPLWLTGVLYLASLVGSAFAIPKILETIWNEPSEGFLRFVWMLLGPVVFLLLVLVLGLLFVSIASLIGGPFYERMVFRVLERRGKSVIDPSFLAGALNDGVVALVLMVPALICTVLAFVPVIGIGFAALAVLLSTIGLGVNAASPALLSLGLDGRGRFRWLRQNFSALLGVGAVLTAAMLVPLLILLVLPAAMVGIAEKI